MAFEIFRLVKDVPRLRKARRSIERGDFADALMHLRLISMVYPVRPLSLGVQMNSASEIMQTISLQSFSLTAYGIWLQSRNTGMPVPDLRRSICPFSISAVTS